MKSNPPTYAPDVSEKKLALKEQTIIKFKNRSLTKQTKPGKGATVRRYIVEWQAEGNSHCKTFPNLPRAQGYAKELTDTAIRLVKGGHDEDGDLAELVESVRIYAATLELVEMTKSEVK